MLSPRLALLICDIPIAFINTHGDYHVIFTNLLQASLDAIDSDKPSGFTLDSYDVMKGIYPAQEEEYDGIIITGSASSAYEDVEWINKLVAYTANIVKSKPHVKIVGICFGHQILGRALGGQCVPNDGKWEVGMTEIDLTDLGKSIFGVDILNIHQMHRDHVPTLPPSCLLLGSTPISPVQGMLTFSSSAHTPVSDSTTHGSPAELLSQAHIFTLQGHPEFTDSMVEALIKKRLATGVMPEKNAAQARERMGWANEGVSVVGRAIWGMFGAKV